MMMMKEQLIVIRSDLITKNEIDERRKQDQGYRSPEKPVFAPRFSSNQMRKLWKQYLNHY